MAFFALVFIILLSGGAPRVLNAKNILFMRSLPYLPAMAEEAKLTSAISAPVSFVAAPQACDIHLVDYCIVDGNFIFGRPVDPEFTEPLAENYKYGLTDEGRRQPHHGVDFSAAIGTSVLAAADGEVVFAGFEKNEAHGPRGYFYGNFIIIRHANDLYTLYAHLSKILVEVGQFVQIGELIGEVGETGVAIGPHLHFEVRRGGDGGDYFSTENPELWLALQKDENASLYGALSIAFDASLTHKVERQIVVEYYPRDAVLPEKNIHTFTYPVGFENNLEDAVLSNLKPGRYRIVFNDKTTTRDRWVNIESGKLTQVYIALK